jgi:2-polyprenyl-3-methyl-5-hydroxy-6-metoxy-1,4-benzoquinol methylase
MNVSKCHLCDSKDLVKILDLGFHPPADFFLKKDQLKQVEKRYPLAVVLCRSCGHAMNNYVVSGEERYQENDYSFNSNHSKISIEHFADMASDIVTKMGVEKGDLVVDIGSNVGTLLSAFKTHGANVQGVDPSPNIAVIAQKDGIPTINDFFGSKASLQILKKGKAKVVTSVNCFNHVAPLDDYMSGIISILREDGVFIIESPHFLALLQKMQFDTIYHEHVSYLAVKPLAKFMNKFGLSVLHAEENDYIGGVIRIYIGRGKEDESVREIIAKEENAQLFNEKTFENYAKKVLKCKLKLLKEVTDARIKEGKIVVIGAAAKGNTLLNYCGIDSSLVEYATDVSPLKIGKYLPGSHILIKSDEDIDESITHALILAWNLEDFLKNKISPKHPNLKFITPHVVVE